MIIAPVWILLAVFFYGLAHSFLAALRTKALTKRWIGKTADRWYRAFFNVFATVTFIPILVLLKFLPDITLYKIPFPWVALTLMIQIAAVVILVLALLQTDALAFIGLRQVFQPSQKMGAEKLVVKGFYQWVRHPLYTAGLVFIWFSPVMTVNLFTLFAGLTAYTVIGAFYEERKLVQEFGEAYRNYQAKTPMVIPGLIFKKSHAQKHNVES